MTKSEPKQTTVETVSTSETVVGQTFKITSGSRDELRSRARSCGVTVSTLLRLIVEDSLTKQVKVQTSLQF